MRIRSILFTIFGVVSLAVAPPTNVFAQDNGSHKLDDAEFRRLHQLLEPSADEPWRTIPWKIALLDAQRNAVDENKPIFIWAMDGHPLGCT